MPYITRFLIPPWILHWGFPLIKRYMQSDGCMARKGLVHIDGSRRVHIRARARHANSQVAPCKQTKLLAARPSHREKRRAGHLVLVGFAVRGLAAYGLSDLGLSRFAVRAVSLEIGVCRYTKFCGKDCYAATTNDAWLAHHAGPIGAALVT